MLRLVFCSLTISLIAVAVAACGDDGASGPPDAASTDPDGGAPRPGDGLAVVNSDYVSTSISLLDGRTGQVGKGNCLDSGTRTPNNTLALSGDVVLPSQPQAGNPLVTIDRSNGALTWIDPGTCLPLRQLDVSTDFFANPHDLVSVSPTKAYVTRYERNRTPTADPADRDEGDDVLIIDPSVPVITGRIAMASYAVAVPNATIQARPDRARLIGGTLFVALSSMNANFGIAGHGRLVMIDTATDQVTGTVDLPTLQNCSGLSYVAATQTLVVACAGSFRDPDQAAGSGLAYIDVAVTPPTLRRTEPATPFGGRALAGYAGTANDGSLGFGVSYGEFEGRPKDELWAYDVTARTATKLLDARDSFTFGTVLADPDRDRVYLTDANAAQPRIHRYRYDADGPVLEGSVDANPGVGLPPREIARY